MVRDKVGYIAFFSFSLRNTSGQTAADLAHAHGFHDCFCLIAESQLSGSPANGVQNGDGAPCGQGRKRLLTAEGPGNAKKARRADSEFFLFVVI